VSDPVESFEHIVVGGGISGLAMAHWAQAAGVPTLLLEADARPGGCIRTARPDDGSGPWAELGAHTAYNSYGNLLDLLERAGALERLVPKRRLPWLLASHGRHRSVTSALHWGELLLHLPRAPFTKRSGRSVAAYYRAVAGPRNYADVLGPAFRAVVCQPADEIPADLLFRRKPRRRGCPRSFTLPGGLSEAVERLAGSSGFTLRTGARVLELRREGPGIAVVVEGVGILHARRLTLAVPPDEAARLLRGTFPALGEALGGIAMRPIDSLALWVPTSRLGHLPPLAGLIATDGGFHGMVSADTTRPASDGLRAFTFHFPPDLDRETRLARACRALGIARRDVAAARETRNRLPALRAGHHERVRRIDAALGGLPLAVVGNAFLGMSIEDCLIRARCEFRRLFGAAGAGS
jgi:protoporphyrinogen oxidase